MLKEYIEKRNHFDFDLIWKTDFLDKYIKQIFFQKGYYRSKQYYQDKQDYEAIFGKYFKYGVKGIEGIDDPYDHEIISFQEVLKKWKRDAGILKEFVFRRNLPAYDFTGMWVDPSIPENQNVDLKECVFLKSEIEEFEILNPWLHSGTLPADLKVPTPTKKLRPSTQIKMQCQERANALWAEAEKNGTIILSTGEMAKHAEIEKIGGVYSKNQRQRWLSEVAPEEAKCPGVRSKTESRPSFTIILFYR